MPSAPKISEGALSAVIWLGVALSICAVTFRTMVRVMKMRSLYEDDFLVYGALAILITMAVLYRYAIPPMFQVEAVSGGDESAITADFVSRAELFLKLQFGLIILFWTLLWTVKLSFMMFLRRLFSGTTGLMKYWYLVLVFIILSYVGCLITQFLSCIPISHYFLLNQCNTARDVSVSNISLRYATSVDIISDTMIMALPMPLLYNLQITTRQKAMLGTIFGLGLIIIIFAIVRVVMTNATTKHVDPVWLALWSMVECAVSVVVACLPSLRVLVAGKGAGSRYAGWRYGGKKGSSGGISAASRREAIRLGPVGGEGEGVGEGGVGRGGHRTVVEGRRGTAGSEEELFGKGQVHVRSDVTLERSPA